MSITRRHFIQQSALAGAGLCAWSMLGPHANAMSPIRRPNILFIFPDQWRRQAFGYAGDPNLRTPVLDALAAQSTEFTRCYANHPVCSPCRAMLQTGLYSHQIGFLKNNYYLPQDPQNLGYRLKDAGYRTSWIGKWHVDGHKRPGFVAPERRQGWDEFRGFNRGHYYRLGDPKEGQARYFTPEGELVFSDVYEPILQTDLALDFMKRQTPGQPWALAVSYGPPHDPYTPLPSHDRFTPGDLRWRDNVPEAKRRDPHAQRDLCGYYGLCELMDEQIGRLLRHLDETGAAENTIVVFTSDHGDMQGSHGRFAKLVPFEEASGIPFFVRGPGIRAGRRIDTPVSVLDFAPTLLGLAGLAPSERMIGRSLAPSLVRGMEIPDAPVLLEGFMHMADQQWRAIVTDRYKLSLVVKENTEPGTYNLENYLFDLQEDPYEMNNLFRDPARQTLVKELTALRAEIAGRTGDLYPALNPEAPANPPA